jgi:hypothetical protein
MSSRLLTTLVSRAAIVESMDKKTALADTEVLDPAPPEVVYPWGYESDDNTIVCW